MPRRNGIDGVRDLVFVGDVGRLVPDRATAALARLDLPDGRRG